ncbi:MAG: 3-keto-5-aminohexanoate cleavage protein [Actinobacteria bacterium]|nr:3-keto-5-aminohexanoate cleavage protein [Actinomycetota bacterium]
MERTPVIIEAAINGFTPLTRNPNVPKSAGQIADDALDCLAAGAAIVHAHGAVFGDPEAVAAEYLAGWEPVLAQRPDALLYPTANVVDGALDVRHLELLAATGLLRVSLCDPGSLNLGGVDDTGVPAGSFVYTNSFDAIAVQMEQATRDRVGPSLAIYEPGFLRCALAWWRAGRLPAGSMFKFYLSTEKGYMGAPFGLPPTRGGLDAYLDMLGDCPVPWAVSVVGGDVVASGLAQYAVERGGHIHLGLEFFDGDRTPTNATLVREAVELCDRLGVAVASPDEAAVILDLPRR